MSKEIILPSGRKAVVAAPTVRDFVVSLNENPILTICILASRLATIDGHPVELPELLDGDMEEYAPLLKLTNEALAATVGTSNAMNTNAFLAKFKKDAL